MSSTVISGTGCYIPPEAISNQEIVDSFNQAVKLSAPEEPLYSDVDFIEKASGIKNRHVIDKQGILDPSRMCPYFPKRADDQLSLQSEMALKAIYPALDAAQKSPKAVDAVLVSCSNMQRPYPAIAIEVQSELGFKGFAFDMNVACSSATFAIQVAKDMIQANTANCVVVVSPEICSGHLNYKDRDSHFIFGDACTACVIERVESAESTLQFAIHSTKLNTTFSNNIRNNAGFLNRCEALNPSEAVQDPLFKQEGRKVFKEVVPMVIEHIQTHLSEQGRSMEDIDKLWLHQANLNMNTLICKKLLGKDFLPERAPMILAEHGNTGSTGSIISFHQTAPKVPCGHYGLLCSFGGGYSIGSLLLQRIV